MYDVWSDELRRTGRVVFPIRRLTVVVRCFLPAVVLAFMAEVSFNLDRDLGIADDILRVAQLLTVLTLLGVGTWHLITGRPTVTVDHEGFRVGRRRFLPWAAIDPIPIPHGQGLLTTLRLHPKVTITRDNVKDISSFARWLDAQRVTHAG
jgi:hypothetical protein